MKSLIKKILVLLTGTMLVAGCISCANGSNEKNADENGYVIEITLPGTPSRAAYYDQSDAASYKVTVSKDSVQIAQKTGTPGSTISFTVPEEGTYDVNVKAYNNKNILIGEGTSSKTVTAGDSDKTVKVVITPKEKDLGLDVDIEWGSGKNDFVKVTGGEITGAAYTDNYEGVFPEGRNVKLSSFYMGKYEVTQAQYKSVMAGQKVTVGGTEYTLADSPSYCTGSDENYKIDFGKDHSNHPVENVTWFDAVYYCNALSAKQNLDPCYTITVTTVRSGHITAATVEYNKAKNGYRLPTEAEWEYAARGGDPSKDDWNYTFSGADKAAGSNYNDLKNTGLDSVGWYRYNNITGTTGDSDVTNSAEGKGTHKVGSKVNGANRLGIYDMSGNVYEWCYDWWDSSATANDSAYTQNDKVVDPVGAASGDYRVYRGGSWSDYVRYASVSLRSSYGPNIRHDGLGFRVCRSSSN